jgi:hypothetical protein
VFLLLLKIDLHVHSVHSDGFGEIDEILDTARSKGLDGLAITDHETLEGYQEALSLKSGLLILPGFEVETDAGHVLVLGLKKLPPRIRRIGYEELIEWTRGMGGLSILAHPAAGRFRLGRWREAKPDAVEALNASYPFRYFVRRGLMLAEKLGVPAVGGSDAHFPETVGDAYTIVDAGNPRTTDILEAIKTGSVGFEGALSPMIKRSRIGIGYLSHKMQEKLSRLIQ